TARACLATTDGRSESGGTAVAALTVHSPRRNNTVRKKGEMYMKSTRRLFVTAFAVTAALGGFSAGASAQQNYTIGMPGIPPVFVDTQAMVAESQGFFKKHGVNVTLRAMDSGAAAARGVAAGQIELSMSPSPLVFTMVSNNPEVGLVTIYGYEKPDWLIGSVDDSITKCEQVK